MKMQRRDLLEQAGQLINGMRSLCQLLECPGVPPITEDVLAVFECVDDEVLRLIDEAMKLDSDSVKNMYESIANMRELKLSADEKYVEGIES